MRPNETELKVSPLLATPSPAYGSVTKANQGHSAATLVQRLRVSGMPNETTPASFSASQLGVNGTQ